MSVGLSGGGAGPVHCPEGHSLRSMYISMLRARMLGVIRKHSAIKREICIFDRLRDICTGDFCLPGARRLQSQLQELLHPSYTFYIVTTPTLHWWPA